jgi:hypothetical protein
MIKEAIEAIVNDERDRSQDEASHAGDLRQRGQALAQELPGDVIS